MICPSCSNEIDDASIMCPICGEAAVRKPSYSGLSYSDMTFDGNDSVVNNDQPSEGYYKYQNSRKNPWVSFAMTVIVIVCLAFAGLFVYKVFIQKHSGYDGTYKLAGMTYEGVEYTKSQMEAVGYDISYMYFKIHGDKITIVIEMFGMKNETDVDLVIDNGKVSFGEDGTYFTGTIMGNRLTIDADEPGSSLIYEKQ